MQDGLRLEKQVKMLSYTSGLRGRGLVHVRDNRNWEARVEQGLEDGAERAG